MMLYCTTVSVGVKHQFNILILFCDNLLWSAGKVQKDLISSLVLCITPAVMLMDQHASAITRVSFPQM